MEDVSYRPSRFVVRTLVIPVSLFTTVTVTSGKRAPVESVTVPRMSPEFVLCAWAVPRPRAHITIKRTLSANRFDLILPPKLVQLLENRACSLKTNACLVVCDKTSATVQWRLILCQAPLFSRVFSFYSSRLLYFPSRSGELVTTSRRLNRKGLP